MNPLKWIRWPGLIVFILLFLALYLALPFALRLGLVATLESAFDAKSDVADLSLSWSDAQLKIQGVVVGDSKQPMQNLFEIERIIVDVDIASALMGDWIIDDMSLIGLGFGTQRQSSAALPKKQKSKESKSNDGNEGGGESALDQDFAAISGMNPLPSADVLLSREPLETVRLANSIEQQIAEQDAWFKSVEADLPDKAKVKSYEKRIKSLSKRKIKSLDDFEQAKADLKAIKKEIKVDE